MPTQVHDLQVSIHQNTDNHSILVRYENECTYSLELVLDYLPMNTQLVCVSTRREMPASMSFGFVVPRHFVLAPQHCASLRFNMAALFEDVDDYCDVSITTKYINLETGGIGYVSTVGQVNLQLPVAVTSKKGRLPRPMEGAPASVAIIDVVESPRLRSC